MDTGMEGSVPSHASDSSAARVCSVDTPSLSQLFAKLSRTDLIAILERLIDSCSPDQKHDIETYALTLASSASTAAVTADTSQNMSTGTSLRRPNEASTSKDEIYREKKLKEQRPFDMSKYRQHPIMLQIQYEGGPYFGFASQVGECEDTIEKHLFESLLKLKLIESRQTCNYTRCGRTDRGVSALGQVVSLTVRSALKADDSNAGAYTELDYCTLLNRSLPENIRVLSWQRVTPEFNARFSAAYRTYRYFFTRRRRDVRNMQAAAALLVGSHDFRNFCKIDIANVSNFVRDVYSAEIKPFMINSANDEESVWMLEIRGIAFLWHMIRCIMAVLFMVGDHGESPEVVTELFNIEKFPGKPFYDMASELPLVLTECGYEHVSLVYEPRVLWSLTAHFESILDRHLVAAARAKNALQLIRNAPVRSIEAEAHCNQLLGAQLKLKAKGKPGTASLKRPRYEDHSTGIDAGVVVESPDALLPWHTVLDKMAAYQLYPTEDRDKAAYVALLQVR